MSKADNVKVQNLKSSDDVDLADHVQPVFRDCSGGLTGFQQ